MHRILIVDDDATNTKLLKFLLTDEGYEVETANSSIDALAFVANSVFDLILLDIMMPGMDGIEVCRRIRQTSTTPIIFLSALVDIKDKVDGLLAGGDDYIGKPFHPNELLARTWAALRRTGQIAVDESAVKTGDFVLDPIDNRVTLARSGKTVSLTPIEARLLRSLVASPGRTITRDSLLGNVWGHEYEGESNQLDVYMKRLRSKIEEDSSHPQLLLTIRGVGYKYQPSDGAVPASSHEAKQDGG